MKIYIKELKREFETKSEAFKALKEAKDTIITAKKSDTLKSSEKLGGVPLRPLKISDSIKGLDTSEGMYHIVVNTTNVLDSHDDLHVKGIWNKTVKDQQGKLNLTVDHKIDIDSIVTRKEHVSVSILDTTFKALGYNLEGETQALIYSVHEDNIKHEKALEWLKSGDSIEASVRMQYLDIELALNSDDKEDENEYKAFKDYSKSIANKSDRQDLEYFWIVKQAKNVSESSLVVAGSNSYTGVYEPSSDTQEETQASEPSADTQKESEINLTDIIGGLKVEKKEGINLVSLIKEIKK